MLAGDFSARITVQTCLQVGLSIVYSELLDFGGDEIYMQEGPRLTGRTYGEALLSYEGRSLMGLRLADGGVRIYPPAETFIRAGDKVIAIAEGDDFIVSDGLTGLLPTQVSENGELLEVFQDLFNSEGSEIYLKPAKDYVATGRAVNCYTVTEAARRRGETAIGYRLERHANDPSRAYGVRVNPPQSEPLTFQPEDRIIVLAED